MGRIKKTEKIRLGRIVHEFSGSTPPSLVVGESGYPRVPYMVAVCPSPIEERPDLWWGKVTFVEIVSQRESSVLAVQYRRVSDVGDEVSYAIASEKPVDVEVRGRGVRRDVLYDYSDTLAPLPSKTFAERIKVVSNPRVPRALDRIINEPVKACDAVVELYGKGVNYYIIQRSFSAGLLGVRKRIVPTKWAITAVDTIVGDYLKRLLRDFREVPEPRYYRVQFLGNIYLIALLPGGPRFEMVEAWLPGTFATRGFTEPYIEYFDDARRLPDDGGYRAARAGVYMALKTLGYKAHVKAVRIVTPDYRIPVGVWQVRESFRNAILQRPLVKGDEDTVLKALFYDAAKYGVFPHVLTVKRKTLLDFAGP